MPTSSFLSTVSGVSAASLPELWEKLNDPSPTCHASSRHSSPTSGIIKSCKSSPSQLKGRLLVKASMLTTSASSGCGQEDTAAGKRMKATTKRSRALSPAYSHQSPKARLTSGGWHYFQRRRRGCSCTTACQVPTREMIPKRQRGVGKEYVALECGCVRFWAPAGTVFATSSIRKEDCGSLTIRARLSLATEPPMLVLFLSS